MVGTAFQSASAGMTKQVKLLLRSGLNVNIKNDKGQNLLVAALMVEDAKKRYQMFRMLLRRGTNVFSVDPTTERDVLLWACVLNRHEEVKLILQEGMSGLDLCKRDNGGYTGLHYVVMNGNKETCKILCHAIVKIGLSVDVPNNDGFTPYILAKRLGHTDCVEVLKTTGHASTYQFDTSQFKMADTWSFEGQKEMSHVDKRLKAKKVIALKTLGRMPQLHDANYKPGKVRIIASRHEKGIAKVMYPGKVHRPWSAPSTKEDKGSSYQDRLGKELQAIYEAKALKKIKILSNNSTLIFPPDREFSFTKPVIPKIRIKVNDIDVASADSRQGVPIMRYTKSMPELPIKALDCETSKSPNQSPRSVQLSQGDSPRSVKQPPSVRKEHWYPPSSSEIWKKRRTEKDNKTEVEKPEKPSVPVIRTNISQLLGVMAEQRVHSLAKPRERVKLLPIDKDVANFIKTRKEAAAEPGKKSTSKSVNSTGGLTVRRAPKLLTEEKGGTRSLDIISEE